ncbi:hypothetical protein [Mycolicibacterium confluentis]|uniref:Uncharacterized protein n=1 Tax=Mycolicibacterium confluentis TaxID=28047 RepID=A0A7I7XT04_9MYCO|nr:hypothetical protein [Mycolicibacterium confluentis]MCV7321135.1 hypothetical protein [Mycolicibacterium confluentis]ORV21268.1 hypothetical protein AWB99_27075 [Mycolicibacterium confluentis]BBZ32389.1 hypothetical protein MCNF_09940 [Mycolicibacterium confluentis]
MTVHVTRDNGVVDDYMRFGDRYVKHADGSLAVIRASTMPTKMYSAGQWSTVAGDERRIKHGMFHR